ncbi:MAG: DUF1385 domain-containing protein [Chloroflexi bacterium]|nr:DUF1385 domain-containing protein [Chloroflexota bacterium]
MPQPFYYGGQALIEGVLIRGQRNVRMAVRRPDGGIWTGPLPLSPLTSGALRRIPLVRGVLVLIEALLMGMRGLNRSAEIAMADPDAPPVPNGELPKVGKTERVSMAFTMAIALVFGIGIFFLLPLFGARSLDSYVESAVVSNVLEGVIRLGLLVGYIWLIGNIRDVKRVFAYHGAEHMTIHAYEHGRPLEAEEIEKFPTAHPRCGTAFLLTVVLVSVVVFTMVGRPALVWAVASRIALLPVIAAVSYEFLRFSGAHSDRAWAQMLAFPGLMLQKLTTRWPDRSQIEVAVAAMNSTLAADGVIEASGPLDDLRAVKDASSAAESSPEDGPLRRESAEEGQAAAEDEAR